METEALLSSANHSHTPSAVGSPTEFIHAPLNHCAPSIRLVRVLAAKAPDSPIQCHLRHASTTSTYLCLSYVWGADDNCEWIFVDGRRFRIRQNLYNFLRVARQQRQWRTRWFWIDAICIDQSNAIERNHQVKQMGDIFAGAVEIISWLGTQEHIVAFLETTRFLGERVQKSSRRRRPRARTTVANTCSILGSSDEEEVYRHVKIADNNANGFRHFCYADYWDRAWITQEVTLARHITFMAGTASVAANLVPFAHEQFCRLRIEALDPRITPTLRGRSLIYLLDRFKLKKSGVARDRVFSLLSMCGDGSDVLIDYDVTDVQVAENVLNSCKRSFCLCTIRIVAFVLRVPIQTGPSQYTLKPHWDYVRIHLAVTTNFNDFMRTKTSPSILYETERYSPDPVLTMYTRTLCRSYRGRIRISTDWTTKKYLASYSVGESFFDGWDFYLLEGCEIELSSDQKTCTAIFSMAFLYGIIQTDKIQAPCCERVTYLGTTSAWPSSKPALTLSG
jgi:hypothetical protein